MRIGDAEITGSFAGEWRGGNVVALLLVLLLLALLFGGLGVFVAKAFLFGLLVVLVLGVLGGLRLGSGRRA